MKKMIIVGAAILASFSSQAAHEVIYSQDIFTLVKFSDEFTEEVTSCQLNIGDYAKDKPRISFFSKPVKELSSVGVSGQVGSFSGSGYQFKIDKGEMIKKGRTSAGGDVVYGNVNISTLDELANGNKFILRVHPENRYVDSRTETYSLKGSSVAISKFKNCLVGS
ncbi:hypothetical protein AB4501_23120 [Vibrio sp. 10N.222.55.E8]|uniref:hypothetical protein n=1 Tax=Vibrio artabrorum TaxID=446374 RepID=UPI0035520E0F